MSWFEEQIKARRENDRNALNDAYSEAINAIVGESFSFDAAEDSLMLILKYYHLPPVKLAEEIQDENEKLSAVCRLSGLMQRPVRLDEGWYRCAFGAFLARLREDDSWVAVLPDRLGRYSFYHPQTHKRIRMNRKNAGLLQEDGICFYKPLPAKSLSVYDLVKFGASSWSGADYLFTYLMLALSTAVGLMTPKLSFFLYSVVPAQGSASLLWSTVLFLTCVNLAVIFLNCMQSMFSARIGVKMSASLRSAAMMRTLSLPPKFFRQYSGGEVISRMAYMEKVGTGIVTMIFSTSATSLFSLAYITQIFNYAPSLVVPSLLVILVNVLFSAYTTWRQVKITKRQMELAAKNNALSIEMVSGVQKIKMAGAEKRMFARYTKAFAGECKVTYNPPMFIRYHTAISLAISLAGQWVIYMVTLDAGIDVAQYYAFQTSFAMISAAISALVGIALEAAAMRPSLEMLRPMLDAVPENDGNMQEVHSLSGDIEISHVSFRYEECLPDVISDLSLKIKAGQYVAVVGKSGCGKTTLLRLLLGFETPRLGAIYYDGRDLRHLEKRSLRQKIGTVMQDDQLFPGDIYSNIVICAPSLPVSRAWEAAEIAGIADDIRAMPMGMHTHIGGSMGGISGGQRQRLVIARAVATRPKLLLFDEATSALDNLTQKKISEALDDLHCTRVVIAHRLSTVRHCDRILYMDNGKIVEDGTYEELVAKNGEFARMVERQRMDA